VSIGGAHTLSTVFVIVMENHDWSDVKGSASAPYINGTLLKIGAHAERYKGPQNTHPSEPNYIWMEAGDDLNISDDDDPNLNYRTTKNHLTRQLDDANVMWKAYEEAIEPGLCPVASSGRYGAKHDPFVFFDDVTDGRDPHSAHCLAHVRPFSDLDGDLASGSVGRYNFLTPDLCDDMHDSAECVTTNSLANGDAWLSREIPKIMASKAYQDGGAIFITWDESDGGDNPIGFIALSPNAKPGYASMVDYTHSSLLRTVQEVFSVRPLLRDAANATSLSDLFVSYP
jgi:phosphatidylinositol-3-phosphatase